MNNAPITYQEVPWTFHLIGANILIHVLVALDSSGSILRLGILDIAAVILHDQWWRLLSATLLHANAIHLLFNCVGLLIFGSMLEKIIKYKLYLLVYIGGGVLANLLVVAIKYIENEQYFAVGSSGSLMAVLGATAAVAWRMRQVQNNPVWNVLFQRMAVILGLQLVIDMAMPANSMLTHLAGFGAGVVLGITTLHWVRRR